MDLNSVLKKIDSLKKEAGSLKPFKPEFERTFWEKFRLEFNYNSNHIEGNTLTYGQTKLLLLFDRTTGDNKGREIEEMKAHDVALKMMTELSSDPESRLTEKLIREINELILVRPYYNDAITQDGQPTKRLITPGEYKKQPNSVLLPDGNMFYYASPEETPALMGDLIEWYNQNKEKLHPVRLAAQMHYKLVLIHPFDDSNGRTTRLVMNFILMQNGYAPIVIESKKKDAYLAALNKADVGDLGAFEKYIAEVSERWQEIFLKAMKGEKIEEEGDFEKEVTLVKKELKLSKKDATINEIYNTSFIPLTKAIEKKIAALDDFFFWKTFQKKVIDSLGNDYNIEAVLNDYKKIDFTNELIIVYSYTHSGLKLKDEKVNYTTQIILRFSKEYYKIEAYPPGQVLIKQHHETLTKEEIETIANEIAQNELIFIKSHS